MALAAYYKTYCMPWNQLIGTDGEMRVKEWLSSKGYQLINFSWNCSYGEIDIIASFFDQLHIIAVTTKTFTQNGLPAEGVTRKKMLSCKQAAQKYLERHPRWKKVMFDVMAISPTENEQEIILLKDIRTV
jgi:putative endonuclease